MCSVYLTFFLMFVKNSSKRTTYSHCACESSLRGSGVGSPAPGTHLGAASIPQGPGAEGLGCTQYLSTQSWARGQQEWMLRQTKPRGNKDEPRAAFAEGTGEMSQGASGVAREDTVACGI